MITRLDLSGRANMEAVVEVQPRHHHLTPTHHHRTPADLADLAVEAQIQ